MKRLAAVTRFETNLWLRSAGFWLTAIVMFLYVFGTYRFTPLYTSRGLGEQIIGSGLLFSALLMMFTSAAAMLRDRAERTEELFDAFPVTNTQLLFSRWLGGAVAWLLLGLAMFIAAGISLIGQDEAILELWPLASFYLSHYVPAVLFIHTLGMTAGVFMPQPFILYPVLTGIWAGMSLGVVVLSNDLRWEFMTLFHLTGIGPTQLRVSALAGIYPFQGYVFWQRVFFFGFMLVLLMLAVVAFRRRREYGDARRPQRLSQSFSGAFAGVLLIILGSYGYVQQYASPIGFDAEAAGLLTSGITIEAYDLAVKLNEPGSYEVTADLRVRNLGEEPLSTLGLILPASCQLSTASLDAFHTTGVDVFTVSLRAPLEPGDTTSVNLVYTCPVQRQIHKLPVPGPREYFIDHIDYPRAQNDAATLARFTLTLEAPADFKLASNLSRVTEESLASGRVKTRYEGEAPRLEVFGGPLAHEVIAGIETYYYPAHAAAARKYVTELADQIAFYESWLGEPTHVAGVTPLPIVVENFFIGSRGRFPTSWQGFLSVSEWSMPGYYGEVQLGSALAFYQHSQALSLWWGANPLQPVRTPFERGDNGKPAVVVAANQYLTLLYASEQDGEIWYERALENMRNEWAARRNATNIRTSWSITDELGLHTRGDLFTAVFLAFHDLRETLGDDALRTVLRALRQHYITNALSALDEPLPLPSPTVLTESSGSVRTQATNTPSAMPNFYPDDEDLLFLYTTIAALPDGAAIAERLLGYLPEPTEQRLRQQWGLVE